MRRTPIRALAVATASLTLLAGTVTAAAGTASAAPQVPGADDYAPGMLNAIERDLGLSAEGAVEVLTFQASASDTQHTLAKTLGDAYAGAWVDTAEKSLYVGVADAAQAAVVEAAGATPVLAENSLAELDAWKAALDGALDGHKAPQYYVDVESNSIVIDVAKGAKGSVAAAVRRAGVPADAVTYTQTGARPRTFIDVVGGNAYYIGGSRCSVGFPATGGFVSAGHCGDVGDTTTSPSGTFTVSSFPGNDYSYVRVNSGNTLIGAVNNYSGSRVNVAGSTAAAVGATVCRSGSTTGWHCGTIQALNSSVTYSEGTVSGLIRTNVCAEPGDSGGSLLAGNQAQGMTSGGSGNCTSGGTTYFQPVNEALSAAGVSLLTGGGGTTPATCTGYTTTFSGSLTSGASAYKPSSSGFAAASGTIRGCLDGPTGTDFDLYLQKLSGSTWSTVAQGITSAPDETVTYTGTSGTYRWLVDSYSGAGSYTGGYTLP